MLKVSNNKGATWIEFQVNKKRYRFNPVPGGKFQNETDLLLAEFSAKQIEIDLNNGEFDDTLKRYIRQNQNNTVTNTKNRKNPDLLELYDQWIKSLKLKTEVYDNHYLNCRRIIEKYNNKKSLCETDWFEPLRDQYAPSSFNKNLGMIKKCVEWGIKSKQIDLPSNPWEEVKSAIDHSGSKANPFTKEEMLRILEAIKTDQFCPKGTHPKHSFYYPLLFFMFTTGTRINEAIALTWDRIDFNFKQITISQSLSVIPRKARRNLKKSTKTGVVISLPLTPELDELFQLLKAVSNSPKSSDWVFKGYQGGYISVRSFSDHVWKPVLESLDIPVRQFRQTRHTCLTHLSIDHSMLMASRVAGHKNLKMVTHHYGRFVGQVELNVIKLGPEKEKLGPENFPEK